MCCCLTLCALGSARAWYSAADFYGLDLGCLLEVEFLERLLQVLGQLLAAVASTPYKTALSDHSGLKRFYLGARDLEDELVPVQEVPRTPERLPHSRQANNS